MNATVAFCTASSMQGLDNPTPERIVLSSCDYAASLTSWYGNLQAPRRCCTVIYQQATDRNVRLGAFHMHNEL